jgi:methionyl aminopeptidase
MYYVGQPSPGRRLVDTTYEAMVAGIRAVKPGATLGDAIQTVAQRERFSIVREYCGTASARSITTSPRCCTTARPARA